MSYTPGSTYYSTFVTSNPTNLALQDADTLPTALAVYNGVFDVTFSLVVAKIGTGQYRITGTVPSAYVNQDRVDIIVYATVAGTSAAAPIDRFSIITNPAAIDSGRAVSFGLNTVTLPSTSVITSSIVGTGIISLDSGPGSGQWRRIASINTSNPSAIIITVVKNWYGLPNGNTYYSITSEDRVPSSIASDDVTGLIPATVNSPVVLASGGLDLVMVESDINARQALAALLSVSAGVLAGAGTTSVTIAAAGHPATNRITATVDSSGNRTAVNLTLPT